MKKTNKKGFTLVELVVVIAVLLILAAIAIPTVSGVIARANASTDTANAKSIETALKYAVAYNATTEGTTGDITNVQGALEKSGMTSTNALSCKQTNFKFYYNTANETVVASATQETNYVELKPDTTLSSLSIPID